MPGDILEGNVSSSSKEKTSTLDEVVPAATNVSFTEVFFITICPHFFIGTYIIEYLFFSLTVCSLPASSFYHFFELV